jgi:hypothetical protein
MSHQPFFYLLYSIASDCEERMKDAYVGAILSNSLDICYMQNWIPVGRRRLSGAIPCSAARLFPTNQGLPQRDSPQFY